MTQMSIDRGMDEDVVGVRDGISLSPEKGAKPGRLSSCGWTCQVTFENLFTFSHPVQFPLLLGNLISAFIFRVSSSGLCCELHH